MSVGGCGEIGRGTSGFLCLAIVEWRDFGCVSCLFRLGEMLAKWMFC